MTQLTDTLEYNTLLFIQLIRDHAVVSGSAFPDVCTITPPRRLNIPTSWATPRTSKGSQRFPTFASLFTVLSSPCEVALHPYLRFYPMGLVPRSPSINVPTPSQKLDVIPKTRKEGRWEGQKEKWKEVSFSMLTLRSQITIVQGGTLPYSFICLISPVRTKAP